jgi:hypothetical protein
LPTSSSPRRIAPLFALVAALGVLAIALLGPSQTLAQKTGRLACATATGHGRARQDGHVCVKLVRKRKAHHTTRLTTTGHRAKSVSGKSTSGKSTSSKAPPGTTPVSTTPASCEDGSAPVAAGGGSFSCGDGSEPTCEDWATPTPAANGKSLICPSTIEEGPEAIEAECEEGLATTCPAGTAPGSDEQACATTASSNPDFICEQEG